MKNTVDFLLSDKDKEKIAKYTYSCKDNSIVSKYLYNTWNYLETFFPDYVAPNVISIAGLLMVIYGTYLTYNFFESNPIFIGLVTIICILTYMNLDSIDGIHARRTQNSSPLGEIVDHGCDSITIVFLGLVGCTVLGITKNLSIWYVTQSLALFFQYAHLDALVRGHLELKKYTGPSESLVYLSVLIGLVSFGLVSPSNIFTYGIEKFGNVIHIVMTLFNLVFVNYVVRKNYKYTANGCSIVYILQLLKSFLVTFREPTMMNIMSDGLLLSAITCDLIMCKMAKKNSSQWIVILAIISQIDSLISMMASLFFVGMNVYEIAQYMNIPLLTSIVRVYCNGVFDLCHLGHKKMFQNAIQYGTKLIVGVHNDPDVNSYKRLPIMSHDYRSEDVGMCKYVSEVYHNAPLIITDQFIDDHKIHIVVCSSEYFEEKDDPLGWYAAPRRRGILRPLPYTSTVSTTDILKRAQEREITKNKKLLESSDNLGQNSQNTNSVVQESEV